MTAALIAALGFVVGVVLAFMRGRVSGARLERAKAQEAELAARDIRDQVDNDVGVLTGEQARKELGTWDR